MPMAVLLESMAYIFILFFALFCLVFCLISIADKNNLSK